MHMYMLLASGYIPGLEVTHRDAHYKKQSICLCIHTYLSVYLSIYISIDLSLSTYISLAIYIYMAASLFIGRAELPGHAASTPASDTKTCEWVRD